MPHPYDGAIGRLWPDSHARTPDGNSHHAEGLRGSVSWDRGSTLRPGLARLDGLVPAAGIADPAEGALPGGGQRAPGRGRADGGAIWTAGGTERSRGPDFDTPVPPGGYAWWYIDGLSDDGQHAITLIAFVGSVFSPYYAWSGRHSPEDHCAINVALYGPRGSSWAMTERRRSALARDPNALVIGPSHMWWSGDGLDVSVNEVTTPWLGRIRGRIRIRPSALTPGPFLLDRNERHRWWPIAPLARIEVELDQPSLRWSGAGYLDMNAGSEPLESGFKRWDWCRATHARGSTLLYEVTLPDGDKGALTLIADKGGTVGTLEPTRNVTLPKSPVWRVERGTRADDAEPARVIKTLEDTPFYARSKVATRLAGETVLAMHESLSLDRFSKPIVKLMLPFRMPRMMF